MRHAAVVLVILLLGLGAWWFASMAAGPDSLPEAAKAPVLPVLGAAGMVGESPRSVTPGDEPRRAEVETKVTSVALDASALNVRVVDASTMQPVPGAEVVWYDVSFDWSKLTEADRKLQSQDLDSLMRQRGHTAVADAQGRVAVRPNGWASMFAHRGDQYGSAVWRPDVPLETAPPFAGEFLLRLQADRTLLVRAVDEQGRLVPDVTVQLERLHSRPDGTNSKSLEHLPPTGPDGFTRLRHVQESFPAGRPILAASLRAQISGADGQPTAIDPAALPQTTVDVVVPAFGSVLVELLGSDGMPWPLPSSSDLAVTLTSPTWTGGMLDATNSEKLDTEGRATFARVRCGLIFQLRGPTGWDPGGEFEGPARQGEQVRAALRMPADAILVAGRVLRQDRSPFIGSVHLRGENKRGSGSQVLALDAEGRFCVPIHKFLAGVTNLALQQQDERGGMRLEATVTLRGPLGPGRNDLGDVVLGEAPLFVAGQVVLTGPESIGAGRRIELAIEGYAVDGRERWETVHPGVPLDAERRFVLRGQLPGQKHRLVVEGDCASPPPREFVRGTRDLRIEVAPGGSVMATFHVDSLWQRLTYRLVPAVVDASAPRRWRQEMREAGRPREDGDRIQVGWLGLPAGPQRLRVGCPGLDPLVDLVVDVPANGPATDPRLLDMDLRGRMRLIRVVVTDAAGQRLAGQATIALRGRLEEGARWHGQAFDKDSGDGEPFVVSEPVDLFVVAAGHRGAIVTGVFTDTTVALQPAPTVTLHWRDAPSLPEGVVARLQWMVPDWPANGPSLSVSRGGGSDSGSAVGKLGLDAMPSRLTDGRATFVWEPPFAVQVGLVLDQKGRPQQFVPLQPAVLDPALLVDGQKIELRADPAAVQAALQKLGAK